MRCDSSVKVGIQECTGFRIQHRRSKQCVQQHVACHNHAAI